MYNSSMISSIFLVINAFFSINNKNQNKKFTLFKILLKR